MPFAARARNDRGHRGLSLEEWQEVEASLAASLEGDPGVIVTPFETEADDHLSPFPIVRLEAPAPVTPEPADNEPAQEPADNEPAQEPADPVAIVADAASEGYATAEESPAPNRPARTRS
jgi:hypothetical protein